MNEFESVIYLLAGGVDRMRSHGGNSMANLHAPLFLAYNPGLKNLLTQLSATKGVHNIRLYSKKPRILRLVVEVC
jgi:hypothetical protein